MMSKMLYHAKRGNALRTLYEAVKESQATVYFSLYLIDCGEAHNALTQLSRLHDRNPKWKIPATVLAALYGVFEIFGKSGSSQEIVEVTKSHNVFQAVGSGVRAAMIERFITVAYSKQRYNVISETANSFLHEDMALVNYRSLQLLVRSEIFREGSTENTINQFVESLISSKPKTGQTPQFWIFDEVVYAMIAKKTLHAAIEFVKRNCSQTLRFSTSLTKLVSECINAGSGFEEHVPFLMEETRRRGMALGEVAFHGLSNSSAVPLQSFITIQWKCPFCKTENMEGTSCTSCGARSEHLWDCVVCSYVNQPEQQFCTVCDSMKSISPTLHPSKEWVCPKCRHSNPRDLPFQCGNCSHPTALGEAIKKQTSFKCASCQTTQSQGILEPWCPNSKCNDLHPLAARHHPKYLWECPRCLSHNAWCMTWCTKCKKVPYDDGHRRFSWETWKCTKCTSQNAATVHLCPCGTRRGELATTTEDTNKSVHEECKYCKSLLPRGHLALCDVCYSPQTTKTDLSVWVCLSKGCYQSNYSWSRSCITCKCTPTHYVTEVTRIPKEILKTTTLGVRCQHLPWFCVECDTLNPPNNLSMVCNHCMACNLRELSSSLNAILFINHARILLQAETINVSDNTFLGWLRGFKRFTDFDNKAEISIWEIIRSNLPVKPDESNQTLGGEFLNDLEYVLLNAISRGKDTKTTASISILRVCVEIVCNSTSGSRVDIIGFQVLSELHSAILGIKADLQKLKVSYLVNMKLSRTDIVPFHGAVPRCSNCLGAHRVSMCPEVVTKAWACSWCKHRNPPEGISQYICASCARFRSDCLHRDISHRTWECGGCFRWNLHLHPKCVYCSWVPTTLATTTYPCSPALCSRCREVHLEPQCPHCPSSMGDERSYGVMDSVTERSPSSVSPVEVFPNAPSIEEDTIVTGCTDHYCTSTNGHGGHRLVIPKKVIVENEVAWPVAPGSVLNCTVVVLRGGSAGGQTDDGVSSNRTVVKVNLPVRTN
eukprot:PhF_6_TR40760/c0_g1_i1/m.61410